MSKIFKFVAILQLEIVVLLLWIIPSLGGLMQGAFGRNSNLWDVFGVVWFFVFMYPGVYLYEKLRNIKI